MAKTNKIYGYARTSTTDQHEDRQIIALNNAGVKTKNIYLDKLSGKDFNRPNYRKLVSKLRKDDLLIIKSIDRLGRNYTEIIAQWRHITQEIGADIRILDMPLLDTTIGKDLLNTFISDLVLQVLSFVAQTEREMMKQRQREGIAVAKQKGVAFGRPKVETPDIIPALYFIWVNKWATMADLFPRSGLSERTFYRRMHEYDNYVNAEHDRICELYGYDHMKYNKKPHPNN